MAVLKHQEARSMMKDAIVLDMGDLRKQAARILTDAKEQARRILDQAIIEKDRISSQAHDEAYELGHGEGLQQGLDDGRQQGCQQALEKFSGQLEELQNAWIQAAQSWDNQRRQIDLDAHQAVLDFALLFAKKLLHRVIEVHDDVIVDQVRTVLGHVLGHMDMTVCIHPQDRSVLELAMGRLLTEFPEFEHIHLMDDEAVDRGGCVLRYGEGEIDATIATQTGRIVELLVPQDNAAP